MFEKWLNNALDNRWIGIKSLYVMYRIPFKHEKSVFFKHLIDIKHLWSWISLQKVAWLKQKVSVQKKISNSYVDSQLFDHRASTLFQINAKK